MKLSLKQLSRFVLAITLLISLSSCNKEADLIGLDTQPGSDKLNVGFTDTTTIYAITQIDDSLRTGYQYAYNLLGSYIDPVFGPFTAGFCTQLRLSSTNASFGTQAVLDSVVLSVAYSGIYPAVNAADRPQAVNVKVFELNEDIYKDSAYYAFSSVQYLPTPLADKNVIFNTTDSVTIKSVKMPAHLRIRLSDQFGNKLLNATSTNLSNNEEFLKYMKGLYLKATQLSPGAVNKGHIAYLSPLSYPSGMTLYYKKEATDTVQKTYSFVITETTARFSMFDHGNKYQYASNDLKSQLNKTTAEASSETGKNNVYFQTAGGTKVFLKFPYFKDWSGTNKYVLNQATLRFKADIQDARCAEPVRIILFEPDSTGGLTPLLDASEGDTYQGGYYNSTTREYQFRVTRYLQKLITTGNINRGIVAVLDSRRTTANRVVIKGTDKNAADRIKLELIFTKVR